MQFPRNYADAAQRLVVTKLAVLLVLFAAPSFAADFGAGMRAYHKGDFKTAYEEWLPLADAGDAEAQYWVANLLADGKGVKEDDEAALSYYLKAAFQGHGEAQHNAAWWLVPIANRATEDEKALSFTLHMRAAVNGVTSAYGDISSAYCFGIGVDENPLLADTWMALAMEPFADRLDVMEGLFCDIFGKNDETSRR